MFGNRLSSKWSCSRDISILTVIILATPGLCLAQEETVEKYSGQSPARWSPFIQGGYVGQGETDMDNGGRFSTSRELLVTGIGYTPDSEKFYSLSLGYGAHDYKFMGRRYGRPKAVAKYSFDPSGSVHAMASGSSVDRICYPIAKL